MDQDSDLLPPYEESDFDETEEDEELYTEAGLEDFARTVEGYLSKCANSQPWEGGPIGMNPHTSLSDVMYRADVPEECWEEVAGRVRCPTGDGPHELYEEVGVKFEQELRYEELMDECSWVIESMAVEALNKYELPISGSLPSAESRPGGPAR